MKKINHSFLKKFNVVLVALLALLGFSSCEQTNLEYFEQPEFTPEFTVKGTITNKVDGKPVEGVRVNRRWIGATLMYGSPTPNFRPKSPVYTNQSGNFVTVANERYWWNTLHIQDVNGAFRDTTIVVQFEKDTPVMNLDIELRPKTDE